MNRIDGIFKNKKLCKEKLLLYGFKKKGSSFVYTKDIVEDQFSMIVTVSASEKISAKVIDKSTNEEYVLHNMPNAAGSFVGKVRDDYDKVIQNIFEKCYETEVFKTDAAKKIIKFVKDKYGDELEFLWSKLPDCAIFRRKDNNKWYGLMLTAKKNKVGLSGEEKIEIFDVRMSPEKLEQTVDNKKYFRGYHMNKKNWITVCLDGSVSVNEIEKLIDESYEIAEK